MLGVRKTTFNDLCLLELGLPAFASLGQTEATQDFLEHVEGAAWNGERPISTRH